MSHKRKMFNRWGPRPITYQILSIFRKFSSNPAFLHSVTCAADWTNNNDGDYVPEYLTTAVTSNTKLKMTLKVNLNGAEQYRLKIFNVMISYIACGN